MKKLRRLLTVLFFLLCLANLWAGGGVLSSPRRVYVVKTEHFEIIFPEESAETAKLVADNADSLYERAKSEVNLQNDFQMPIIISPDSAALKVQYTSHPYNRIVVFDSVATKQQVEAIQFDKALNIKSALVEEYRAAGKPVWDWESDLSTQNESTFAENQITTYLLSLLYHEIFRAVSISVRSPVNHFIYKTVGGDTYQPIALMYLPFSFVEGFAELSSGCANDAYYQQLLIQAKIENHFPTWFQAVSKRDIHPGTDLNYAASTAFVGYLMYTYGIEKYMEFWNECSKLNLLFLNGLFLKVYGKPLRKIWVDFKDSVPVPPSTKESAFLENQSAEVFKNDTQGLYEHILYTNYGLVWYDGIRHEVDIYDFNSNFKIRQLLFIAENITRLSLSPDGRYISVSFSRGKSRDEFKEVYTRIFDVKEREFLDYNMPLRDAGFVLSSDGQLCLGGINVDKKVPVLQVYALSEDADDSCILFEKEFPKDSVPYDVNMAAPGKVCYVLNGNICIESFLQDDENAGSYSWALKDKEGHQIYPQNLTYVKDGEGVYSFTYIPESSGAITRCGYISFSENMVPAELFLQDCDVSGGIYHPFSNNGIVYYCSKKFSHNELRFLEEKNIPFVKGEIVSEKKLTGSHGDTLAEKSVFSVKEKTLGEYPLTLYNPIKYMMHVSFAPMLAIRDITLEKGPELFPALGLNFSSDTDPMRNTEFIVSAGADFLVLTFEKYINEVPEETKERYNQLTENIKKYSFAAYITNASTPVDISAGAIFNVNQGGDYDFKALANTTWNIPIGPILRDINYSISSIYSSSTDYYDSNKADYNAPLPGWTPFWDAYELFEVSASVKYSNSHQYGISKYERRGLTVGARLYSLWDIYEMDLLNEFRNMKKQEIEKGIETELTEAQLDSLYEENMQSISQLNMGLFASVEIPRLTPLEIKNGWVLSLPATIHAAVLNQTGQAFEAGAEVLLLGNEIQNGFSFLYLYFLRAGIKAGFDFYLNYDTTKVRLPDIRRDGYLYDVFSQTYATDCFYFTIDTDFLIPVGKLSEFPFKMTLKNEFFPRTSGYKLTFDITAKF